MTHTAPATVTSAMTAAHARPDVVHLPAHVQQFIALDFGTRRTGAASGNRLLTHATPLPTIHASAAQQRLDAVARLVAQWQPQALVIGVPRHPDGAAHENTQRALKFGRQLRSQLRLPVYEVDERYSTTEALSQEARDPDAASACIILEQFLRSIAPS